jgi:hypothetical protein
MGGTPPPRTGFCLPSRTGASSPSLISDEGFHPFFDGFLNPVIADAGTPPSEVFV